MVFYILYFVLREDGLTPLNISMIDSKGDRMDKEELIVYTNMSYPDGNYNMIGNSRLLFTEVYYFDEI